MKEINVAVWLAVWSVMITTTGLSERVRLVVGALALVMALANVFSRIKDGRS